MRKLLAAILVLSSPIYAQAQPAQQPDPAFLSRIITELQTQRNTMADSEAVLKARMSALQNDLDLANTRIKDLESKLPPPQPAGK